MPYEISFAKTLPPLDHDEYINRCCIGGDIVVNQLLSAVTGRYTSIETNQEDWGWFIWMTQRNVRLAIDIHTDDERGLFRVRLTSSRGRWLRPERVEDTPELDQLRTVVIDRLTRWVDGEIECERVEPD
jgi:hypothetical protein